MPSLKAPPARGRTGVPAETDNARRSTPDPRTRRGRLRAPLLLTVWALLGFEAAGGLVIFFARLVYGSTPGETLHVVVGLALIASYSAYQWHHWKRVRPVRAQLDYALGLFALAFMTLTLATGLALGVVWWRERILAPTGAEVRYPTWLAAAHNVASVMVLAFVAAHLGAVLLRDQRSGEARERLNSFIDKRRH